MNPEYFLQYIGSKEFAESILSGVAGNAAYDAVKPTIEKIKSRLTGRTVSEDEVKNALEELIVQIGAYTNLNINQLREELFSAFPPGNTQIPRQLTPYTPIDAEEECIGRDEDLKKLEDTLRRSPKVVVVNGLGGIGKTTVAKAWFQAARAGYDHFLWIEMAGNDDRRDTRAASFAETVAYHPTLASNLCLSFVEKEPVEVRFQQIMNALRRLNGRNLLVIDNAGADLEQKEIREQLPLPPDWQVLVTSRSKLNGFEQMLLDRLSPGYAAEVFRKYYTGDCPADSISEILREVDYHTLTVELLAKTLENHLGSLTVDGLLDKLRRRQLADVDLQRRISLNHSPEETEIYLHLLATFDCAGLDSEERLLLARLAALPPGSAYSVSQLEDWGLRRFTAEQTEKGNRTLQEALLRLDRKGWITRSPKNTFSLHRMIQQAALYQLQPGIAEIGVLVEVFTQKMDFDTSTDFTRLFQWIPYARQILAALPENNHDHADVGKLRNNLGVVYRNLGQYDKARDLLEAALESAVKNFGPEHPNVAVRQNNLAYVLKNLGEKEAAVQLMQKAYALRLKLLGPEHPYTKSSAKTLRDWGGEPQSE